MHPARGLRRPQTGTKRRHTQALPNCGVRFEDQAVKLSISIEFSWGDRGFDAWIGWNVLLDWRECGCFLTVELSHPQSIHPTYSCMHIAQTRFGIDMSESPRVKQTIASLKFWPTSTTFTSFIDPNLGNSDQHSSVDFRYLIVVAVTRLASVGHLENSLPWSLHDFNCFTAFVGRVPWQYGMCIP